MTSFQIKGEGKEKNSRLTQLDGFFILLHTFFKDPKSETLNHETIDFEDSVKGTVRYNTSSLNVRVLMFNSPPACHDCLILNQ